MDRRRPLSRGDERRTVGVLDRPTPWTCSSRWRRRACRTCPGPSADRHLDEVTDKFEAAVGGLLATRRGNAGAPSACDTSVVFDPDHRGGRRDRRNAARPRAWRDAVSRETSLLLAVIFRHGADWVQLCTDERNGRSACRDPEARRERARHPPGATSFAGTAQPAKPDLRSSGVGLGPSGEGDLAAGELGRREVGVVGPGVVAGAEQPARSRCWSRRPGSRGSRDVRGTGRGASRSPRRCSRPARGPSRSAGSCCGSASCGPGRGPSTCRRARRG